MDLLNEILQTHKTTDVAKLLNVSKGTVDRWVKKNTYPEQYTFDLMKIANKEIDYTTFTTKQKDQFFTTQKNAKYCYDKFVEIIEEHKIDISDYTYIEPSAGDGAFLNVLPQDKTIALDIEPRDMRILKQDFLLWKPEKHGKYITFGNPPFGLRGHLALKFINHSYNFSDFCCFILPQLFESDGKGVPRKRVVGYNLIHSEKINTDFYEPCSKDKYITINCIFQIWAKNISNEKYKITEMDHTLARIYSLSDGDEPSQIRNKHMIGKCDFYLPSTCFGKENMKYHNDFEKLPSRRGYGIVINSNKDLIKNKCEKLIWSDIGFKSTNSAYNIRSSQIMNTIVKINTILNNTNKTKCFTNTDISK